MFTNLKFKISAVAIIFLAFAFRLLFVNFGILTSLQGEGTPDSAGIQMSVHEKGRTHTSYISLPVNGNEFGNNEIYIEDSDNEEEIEKANSPAILSVLFSFLKHVLFIPKFAYSFDLIKCCLYGKMFLALSVIRI